MHHRRWRRDVLPSNQVERPPDFSQMAARMASGPFTSDGSEIMAAGAGCRLIATSPPWDLGQRDSGICRTRGCEHLEQLPPSRPLNPVVSWGLNILGGISIRRTKRGTDQRFPGWIAAWSFSALECGQFFVEQCAHIADSVADGFPDIVGRFPRQSKPVDDRLRHMAGVVR